MQGLLQKQNREVKTITSRNIQTTEDSQKEKKVLNSLKDKVVEYTVLSTELAKNCEHLVLKKKNLQQEVSAVKKTLREKTGEFLEVKSKVESLEKNMAENKVIYKTDVKRQSEEMLNKKVKFEKEIQTLQDTKVFEEKSLKDLGDSCKDMAQEYMVLGQKYSELEKQIEERQFYYSELTTKIILQEGEYSKTQDKFDTLSTSIAKKKNEYQILQVDVSSLSEEKIKAEVVLERVQKEVKTSEGKLLRIAHREERVNELANNVNSLYSKAGVEVDV